MYMYSTCPRDRWRAARVANDECLTLRTHSNYARRPAASGAAFSNTIEAPGRD